MKDESRFPQTMEVAISVDRFDLIALAEGEADLRLFAGMQLLIPQRDCTTLQLHQSVLREAFEHPCHCLPRRADVLGDLLMGHAYRVGAGTLRFGKEKFCQPPIQSLEHNLLHRPHHIRKAFPFRVRSRMTRTEAVSVCVPYQWQLCLPQP